ncbi:hypothetical protein PybrP1_007835 [[Pythium] brassicae (nom. inval.)]|nr:hypothetical protein PybrP1_007835 [[Pythium] brassicae (nom. inval.)]
MSLALGVSLPPDSAHALSVSLPTWADVVGYEEGRPEVLAALACGYPRFFVHPFVTALVTRLKARAAAAFSEGADWDLAVSPTRATAHRLRDFLLATARNANAAVADADVAVERVRGGAVFAVRFPARLAAAARQFWQHSGEIVSSRHAQLVLALLERDESESESEAAEADAPHAVAAGLRMQHTRAHAALRARIAALYAGAPSADDVFVYPTGMAAIFASVRLASRLRSGAKSLLVGFPYVDTLKILSRAEWCAGGVHFVPVASEPELRAAEDVAQREPLFAVVTEFPGNPLLSTPDLGRLARLAHANGAVLVVDDTVGSYNVDVLQRAGADVVTTSLSKLFSGTCAVMGGSVVLNPAGPFYAALKREAARMGDNNDDDDDGGGGYLIEEDAHALLESSADLLERLARVNRTTSVLVQRLRVHPLVQRLYYPEVDNPDGYNKYRSVTNGGSSSSSAEPRFGPLFSLVLKGGLAAASAFYDALDVAKGPSLGTNFTICCPYTLLAHYAELDFAEACGVDRHLLRISVGLEDADALWAAIERALQAATVALEREESAAALSE